MSESKSQTHSQLRAFPIYVIITLVTLAACEAVLRIRDPWLLRAPLTEKNLSYRHDRELGWFPIANSKTKFTATRTIDVQNNSLGLRDIEYSARTKAPILFLGDSFVWGYDAEVGERFTDILRRRLRTEQIVNAGVSGYGTDQEYLLLNRLWDRISPRVVVLIFCTNNDRLDNITNQRYEGYYKPYYALTANGGAELRGIPVPWSRSYFVTENWVFRNFWLARLVIAGYLAIVHPKVYVPDPTERLVGMIKEFVEHHGARFVMGLQRHDDKLESFLHIQGISYTTFDGADHYPEHGQHWTPEGNALVAKRLLALFGEASILRSDQARP